MKTCPKMQSIHSSNCHSFCQHCLSYCVSDICHAGIKFRRVSSNKNHSRSASTGDILSNSPTSFPEATVYNPLLHSATKGPPKIHRNSSSSQGESFHHLQSEAETVEFSAYSIPAATSLDSVTPGEYERPLTARQRAYSHHSRSHSREIEQPRGGGENACNLHRRNRHSLQLPSSEHSIGSPRHNAPLGSHSSRESFLSGRGIGAYARHAHIRDSMSQDTMGERDFDYQYRYNPNNSTIIPTLSLQDSFQRDNVHGGRAERGGMNENRNLSREFDVMPIHEAFTHRAMVAATAGPGVPLSPPSQNPVPKESSSRAGGSPAVINQQPVTSPVETQHNHSLQCDTQQNTRSHQRLPQTYHPVFFSPESGQLYMCEDGSYKPIPNHYDDMNITDGSGVVGGDRGPQLNHVSQASIVIPRIWDI